VYSGTEGHEERFAADIVNVLRVVCDLCGVDAGSLGDLNASKAAEEEEKRKFLSLGRRVINELIFFGSSEVREISEAISELIGPGEPVIAQIFVRDMLCFFEMPVLLSEDGAHTKVRVTCEDGKMRFIVSSRTCSTTTDIEASNITDFLIETYLRYYHNERCEDTAIGRGEYRYLVLRLSHCERYFEMCLDEILNTEEKKLHPRLWHIKDQVVPMHRPRGILGRCMDRLRYPIQPARPETENSAVKKAFKLCVQGGEVRDIDLKELASSRCTNMLSCVVKRSDLSEASDECIVGILSAFIYRNKREMVEYVDGHLLASGRNREEILRKAFLGSIYTHINGMFKVSYNRFLKRFETGLENTMSLYKYSILFKDYCSVEVLHAETGERAMQCKYEHFFTKASSVANDLSLIVVVRNTWRELKDMSVLYGYVREFIEKDGAYEFIRRLLRVLLTECVYLPRELWMRMQELYRRKLLGEMDDTKRKRLSFILKRLSDIEHEGLSVEDDVLSADSIEFLIEKNPKNRLLTGGVTSQ
jgi:hypothetical protein